MQRGTVTRFNKNSGYYWIDYDNNDSEELTHGLVERYRCKDKNPDLIKRFTRNTLRNLNNAVTNTCTGTHKTTNNNGEPGSNSRTAKNDNGNFTGPTKNLIHELAKQAKIKNRSDNKFNNNKTTNKNDEPKTIPLPPHYAMAVFDEATGKMMEMQQLVRHPNPEIRKKWIKSVSNEYGRLMKGVGRKTNNGKSRVGDGHDTFRFIKKSEVPRDKIST